MLRHWPLHRSQLYHPQFLLGSHDLQAHKNITCIPKPPNSRILANISLRSNNVGKSALMLEIILIMFNKDDELNPRQRQTTTNGSLPHFPEYFNWRYLTSKTKSLFLLAALKVVLYLIKHIQTLLCPASQQPAASKKGASHKPFVHCLLTWSAIFFAEATKLLLGTGGVSPSSPSPKW